jgi:hypothetical protein
MSSMFSRWSSMDSFDIETRPTLRATLPMEEAVLAVRMELEVELVSLRTLFPETRTDFFIKVS